MILKFIKWILYVFYKNNLTHGGMFFVKDNEEGQFYIFTIFVSDKNNKIIKNKECYFEGYLNNGIYV
jgi:hypothetical protein